MGTSNPGGGKKRTRGMDVPDLEAKLELLYARRGYGFAREQRAKIVVCDRPSLCSALDVDRSQPSRWIENGHIPRTSIVERIAAIFSIESRWLGEPFEEFERLLTMIPALPPWTTLLSLAREEGSGSIRQVSPSPHQALAVLPDGARARLPIVDLGSLIAVTFNAPQSSDGVSLWKHWHATLLSESPEGFLCVLPRYGSLTSFVYPRDAMFSDAVRFECEGLRVEEIRTGVFSFVLIAHQEPLPLQIRNALMQDREGETLQPVLDALATHVLPLCRGVVNPADSSSVGTTAGVLRLRFRVL